MRQSGRTILTQRSAAPWERHEFVSYWTLATHWLCDRTTRLEDGNNSGFHWRSDTPPPERSRRSWQMAIDSGFGHEATGHASKFGQGAAVDRKLRPHGTSRRRCQRVGGLRAASGPCRSLLESMASSASADRGPMTAATARWCAATGKQVLGIREDAQHVHADCLPAPIGGRSTTLAHAAPGAHWWHVFDGTLGPRKTWSPRRAWAHAPCGRCWW
jgi:hypothetical protein